MTSIAYIIATCAHNKSNKDFHTKVLDYQLEQLHKIICSKKEKNIENYIKYVIIVIPKTNAPNEIISEYYQFDKWFSWFNSNDVKLVLLPYEGENKHHSYDQYIEAVYRFPTFDYYFIIEDDYFINCEQVDFDINLVKWYREIFPNNIGYLCTMVDYGNPYHAGISNGLISLDSWKQVGLEDILSKFYKVNHRIPQIAFSLLFLENNVNILDCSNEIKVIFWRSYEQEIVDFTNYDKDKKKINMILPFQTIL